ncbi:MAG: hypothetical protein IKQ71_00825 [Lachnospiraceae bacterium]|nr:hypothetical protein [Lachnospiraceae bacterium]
MDIKKRRELLIPKKKKEDKDDDGLFDDLKDNIKDQTEEGSDEDEEEEKKVPEKTGKKTFLKVIFVVLIILILVVGGLGIYTSINTGYYNGYEVVASYELDDAMNVEYMPYSDNCIKYSRDGVSYINKTNQTVWMESYALKMPKATVKGDYIVVADYNGDRAYLFGKEGKLKDITTQYNIIDADVALQGVFAVVLESDVGNQIIIYDKNGEKVAEISTTVESSGFPVDIALSDDGKKLFVSFAYFDGMTLKNQIGTYNFGEVGQNENADRFMGGFELDNDTLVSKVSFIDNDNVCAFGDNKLIFYEMREKPVETARVEYTEEINSIFHNQKYVGCVSAKSQSDAMHAYEIRAYNNKGRLTCQIDLDIAFNHISSTENYIIVTGDSECRIYDYSGRTVFAYSFPKRLVNLIPTANPKEYIALYEGGSEFIKLIYNKEETTEVK